MSKKMKQFKQQININRGVSMSGEKMSTKVEVTIKENFNAIVERGNIRANDNEIKEIVKDVFTMKNNLSKGERIRLSDVIDVSYDLLFLGVKTIGTTQQAILKVC